MIVYGERSSELRQKQLFKVEKYFKDVKIKERLIVRLIYMNIR